MITGAEREGDRGGGGGGWYLNEREFARTLVQVIDDHLAIEIHPPLTSEQVVNTRCHFLPSVVVAMPTKNNQSYTMHKK